MPEGMQGNLLEVSEEGSVPNFSQLLREKNHSDNLRV